MPLPTPPGAEPLAFKRGREFEVVICSRTLAVATNYLSHRVCIAAQDKARGQGVKGESTGLTGRKK